MPDFVVRGEAAQFDTYFYADGTANPLIVIGGVTYSVTTPNGLVVSSGVAIQDLVNAALWHVTFTIPASAPLTEPDQRYNLCWRAKSSSETVSNNVSFQVTDQAVPDPIQPAIITFENTEFSPVLILPVNTISSLSLRILNMTNQPVITLPDLLNPSGPDPAPITPTVSGANYIYSVPIDDPDQLSVMTLSANGLTTYLSYFNYTDAEGNKLTEVQPIYLANALIMSAMNDVRQFCDMLRNNDSVIELRITDIKLIHFVFKGMERLNATSPYNFTFNFTSLGQNYQFYFWMVKCAQYELLSALYLAEGMTAFDFQGMTVQLNSDRTQYIQTLMSDLKNDIDNTLPKVKSQFARGGGSSGQIGTIGSVWGPASNWVFRATPFNTAYGPLPVLPFLA
jgi:hypothetical protein